MEHLLSQTAILVVTLITIIWNSKYLAVRFENRFDRLESDNVVIQEALRQKSIEDSMCASTTDSYRHAMKWCHSPIARMVTTTFHTQLSTYTSFVMMQFRQGIQNHEHCKDTFYAKISEAAQLSIAEHPGMPKEKFREGMDIIIEKAIKPEAARFFAALKQIIDGDVNDELSGLSKLYQGFYDMIMRNIVNTLNTWHDQAKREGIC